MESDVVATQQKTYFFSNRDLAKLFIPLIIEQGLEYLVGLIASILVSRAGEAAVSGVSLVEFLMALFISIFAAFATGGGIVAGQYLGDRDGENANKAVNQLAKFTLIFSIVITVFIFAIKPLILNHLFGSITPAVHAQANRYFNIVALSTPFIAMYNCGAAIFRTLNKSRLPMNIRLVMNGLNILMGISLIYGLGWGVEGVAVPILLSRVGAMVLVLWFAHHLTSELTLGNFLREKVDWQMIKKVLGIGLPFGFENGMFFLGRLIVLSIVSLFGTAAIAANSVGGTIIMFQALPGISIVLGLAVIISKCVGAGDYEQAEYYKRKVSRIIHLANGAISLLIIAAMPLLMKIYDLSAQATHYVWIIVLAHGILVSIFWNSGYVLPVVFRSAGDANFPMVVSTLSMLLARVVFAYIFSVTLGMGMLGTWAAMFLDWFIKGIIYEIRYRKGTWKNYKLV
ncbi:MATE family efflux transporter [Streptococcus gallolyticus]|uniref:MATE family efflux transporter n=1 Tax=Streptococcus gallolyticus TaxID=315405 RepID=UPI00211BD7FC|nr:MATE family efflux transporter [Streptococcus gallolyticus]MCQ9216921.1 MATE family efflux transporter [Streptococcus gallolyticus]